MTLPRCRHGSVILSCLFSSSPDHVFGEFSIDVSHIHAYIHAYVHTCIQTYIHTYIYTQIHTCIHNVTRPFYKNRLHWIPDPAPPAPRRLDDLALSTYDPAIPTPPSEAHPMLPRRLRPRRRRKRRTAATANETPPTLSANSNSAHWTPPSATQPRSSANDLPGGQPGTRSTPITHPQSFTSSPLSQHPLSAANRNADRRSRLDHPEIRGVYKPARNDTRQDSTANRQRDNFSRFGLSSPALQQPPTNSFSGSPSRQHLTDPTGEAREAGRQRPGII